MSLGSLPGTSRRAVPQQSHRKARDRSIALLLIGAVALLPPLAGIFLIDGSVFGVPFPLVYVFAIWALLVAGAAGLSRALLVGDELPPPTDDPIAGN